MGRNTVEDYISGIKNAPSARKIVIVDDIHRETTAKVYGEDDLIETATGFTIQEALGNLWNETGRH